MTKDFFDEDLVSGGTENVAPRVGQETGADEAPGRENWKRDRLAATVSDLNLTRLAREKRQLDGHVAGAVHEMEQLERRQKELEQRKVRLEDLARKQEQYERSKREIIEQLDRSLIVMEKDEVQASRMVDLLQEIRGQFKTTVDEIRAINEENWPTERFEEELDRAVVRVDEAMMLFKKGVNRVEAVGWKKGDGAKRPVSALEESAVPVARQGFWYWLKAGAAFSLPLIVVISALFIAYLVLTMGMF